MRGRPPLLPAAAPHVSAGHERPRGRAPFSWLGLALLALTACSGAPAFPPSLFSSARSRIVAAVVVVHPVSPSPFTRAAHPRPHSRPPVRATKT